MQHETANSPAMTPQKPKTQMHIFKNFFTHAISATLMLQTSGWQKYHAALNRNILVGFSLCYRIDPL